MTTTPVRRAEERFRLEGRGRSWRGGRRPLVGVLLVVVCVAVFVVVGGRRDGRRDVLLVTRPVPAGQLLVAGDVRAVSVTVDPAVRVVRAGEVGQVVGRPAAVALSAGMLLSPGSLGRRLVPEGSRLVGASLKPGTFPPGLAAGDPVTVLVTSQAPAADGVGTVEAGRPASSADGLVTAVETAPAGSGGLVVSVQVAAQDADVVARAAAGGQVALVLRGVR